jgi:hypothetical protein
MEKLSMTERRSLEFPQALNKRPDLLMPGHQRRKLLKEWASGERKADSDIVARVALDEIEELDLKVLSYIEEINRYKKGVK